MSLKLVVKGIALAVIFTVASGGRPAIAGDYCDILACSAFVEDACLNTNACFETGSCEWDGDPAEECNGCAFDIMCSGGDCDPPQEGWSISSCCVRPIDGLSAGSC